MNDARSDTRNEKRNHHHHEGMNTIIITITAAAASGRGGAIVPMMNAVIAGVRSGECIFAQIELEL
jgi:hypothetical protein